MSNKAREQVRREQELVRRYIDKNLSDDEIIEQMQISEPTFYRIKKKLRQQITKTWEKENKDNTNNSHARLSRTLEYCYRETKKIIDDHNTKTSDRIEAIKTLDVLAAQIATLEDKGPIFTPTLPSNKVIPVTSKDMAV